MAEKKMETKKEETPVIVMTELKQKQSVLNLDTMAEVEITVVTKKYSVDESKPLAEQLKAAAALVHPDTEKIKAFLTYATSKSYQESKAAELAKGNFLTPQIRSAVVQILQTRPQFAELKASEVYDRWLTGFKEKKPAAVKILEQAKSALGEDIDL